jgi:hypothetical protein
LTRVRKPVRLVPSAAGRDCLIAWSVLPATAVAVHAFLCHMTGVSMRRVFPDSRSARSARRLDGPTGRASSPSPASPAWTHSR